MRPLVFHLADNAMVEGLKAFFRRDNWHYAIGCDRFAIDTESELDFYKVPGRNDQAVWKQSGEHLTPFQATHERAIVILDEHFDPSPGAEQIKADVMDDLRQSGWKDGHFEVIVIQPMLESWLWMESDHVAKAFGCEDYVTLRRQLIDEGFWHDGHPKPHNLKGARDRAADLGGTRSGRAAFRNVFASVSSKALNYCQEPGFNLLRETLRNWFPPLPPVWAK